MKPKMSYLGWKNNETLKNLGINVLNLHSIISVFSDGPTERIFVGVFRGTFYSC